jgi:hypothetical protein
MNAGSVRIKNISVIIDALYLKNLLAVSVLHIG